MNDLMNLITEPLQYPFMQNALMTSLIVAIICAMLSCYIVLKGWSLMGDAISHAVLPGVVLAFLLGIPLAIGAFFSGIFCALVMFTKIETEQHLTHILLGSILGVSNEQLQQTAIIAAIVFSILMIKRKDLLLYCFDASHARVAGLSPKWLHYGLLILLALTIVSSMQVVGVILVVAMLIAPGIIGLTLTQSFDKMLLIATLSACTASLLGVILSYHFNASTGASIILIQAVFFLAALAYSRLKVRYQK